MPQILYQHRLVCTMGDWSDSARVLSYPKDGLKFSGGVWRRYSAPYPTTSYTYDVWGHPLTTTGTMADTLGKLNPFRYKY